jgi:tetratricopeptide (TPR) repeat protein
MPAADDRSILWEPSGLKRTAGTFDDHGELRPLGQGPDLYMRMSVPRGAFLMSLYFFEVDWIQYRAHKVRLLEEGTRAVLAETIADNFLKGKYKRFVVYGPVELVVVIERGQSPNAQVSGIFFERLSFPDLYAVKMAEAAGVIPRHGLDGGAVPTANAADQAAEEALGKLLKEPAAPAADRYFRQERIYVLSLRDVEAVEPEVYYRDLDKAWSRVADRLAKAVAALPEAPAQMEARLLKYSADRARCDFASARDEMRTIAWALSVNPPDAQPEALPQARLLEQLLADSLVQGRRAEAAVLLEAYCARQLRCPDADAARQKLTAVGKQALSAGVTLPLAEALEAWEGVGGGKLTVDDRLLLGSLYYVAGRNEAAVAVYRSVEPEMPAGQRHRWVLIAMVTALLRTDRVDEAVALRERLEKAYPGTDEIHDVRYRFGEYYAEKGERDKAKKCFRDLMASTNSPAYTSLCSEYLDRIERQERLDKQHAAGP